MKSVTQWNALTMDNMDKSENGQNYRYIPFYDVQMGQQGDYGFKRVGEVKIGDSYIAYSNAAAYRLTDTVFLLNEPQLCFVNSSLGTATASSHPAIVSKEVYNLVQMEIEKRSRSKNYKPAASIFSGLMFCGECGSLYGSKVWHSNSKYRRTIWQCNKKFKNVEKCGTPHLTEDTIKNAFMSIFNEMVDNIDTVIAFTDATIQILLNTDEIDKKIDSAKRVTDKKLTEGRDYVKWSMKTAIIPDEYNRRLDELKEAYESANAMQMQFEQERATKIERSKRCRAFINQIKNQERLQEFDDALFSSIIEKITVLRDKLIFEFKSGETREFIL